MIIFFGKYTQIIRDCTKRTKNIYKKIYIVEWIVVWSKNQKVLWLYFYLKLYLTFEWEELFISCVFKKYFSLKKLVYFLIYYLVAISLFKPFIC